MTYFNSALSSAVLGATLTFAAPALACSDYCNGGYNPSGSGSFQYVDDYRGFAVESYQHGDFHAFGEGRGQQVLEESYGFLDGGTEYTFHAEGDGCPQPCGSSFFSVKQTGIAAAGTSVFAKSEGNDHQPTVANGSLDVVFNGGIGVRYIGEHHSVEGVFGH